MPTVSAGLHQFPRRRFVTYKTKATIHELESNLKEAMEGTIDSIAVVSKYSLSHFQQHLSARTGKLPRIQDVLL